jgi:hypothetical protein
MKVTVSDLLNRRRSGIRNYAEFLLLMHCSRVLKTKKFVLDFSDAYFEDDFLSEDMKLFLKNMVQEGCVVGINASETDELSKYNIPLDEFDKISDIVYEESKDGIPTAIFDSDYFKANSKKYSEQFNIPDIEEAVMLNVLANFIVSDYLRRFSGKQQDYRILFRMNGMIWPKNPHFFLSIYGLTESLSEFNLDNERIKLVVVNKSGYDTLNHKKYTYEFFLKCATLAGKYKKSNRGYTIGEKRNFLKENGIQEGSIVVLYFLPGTKDSDHFELTRKIENASFIRVDKILDGYIEYTKFFNILSDEEDELRCNSSDVFSLQEECNSAKVKTNMQIDLYHTGVGYNMSFSDTYNIMPLQTYTTVRKPLRLGESVDYYVVREVDYLYWSLNQKTASAKAKEIFDFDRDLFKSMYSDGLEMLWDMYNKVN